MNDIQTPTSKESTLANSHVLGHEGLERLQLQKKIRDLCDRALRISVDIYVKP